MPLQREDRPIPTDASVRCSLRFPSVQHTHHFRYLSNVERRVHDLESLFSRLLPNVDIETALASTDDASSTVLTSSGVSQSQSDQLTSPLSEIADNLETIPDTAPSGAEGYDWTEEISLDYLADGMAALRIEPTGAGYLGESVVDISSPQI